MTERQVLWAADGITAGETSISASGNMPWAPFVGGMALHGGVIPYTATFFTFADYMRPPIRLAALMGLRVIYVFTHDSIAVGEDGPTHQPIEQLMNLRSVPNLSVIRPVTPAETAQAWQAALANRRGPTALVLTRQNVPNPNRQELAAAAGLQKGGYILWDSSQVRPDVIFIATGSEVHLALAAARKLTGEAIRVPRRFHSSWDMFDAQPAEYRDRVLPPAVKARVAVEAGARFGLGTLCGPRRSNCGHGPFRRQRPRDRAVRKVRPYGGSYCRYGKISLQK